MKFEEALPALREGKRIGRQGLWWIEKDDVVKLLPSDLLAEDWEIYEQEQLLTWRQIHAAMKVSATWTASGLGFNFDMVQFKDELGFE